MKQTTKFLFTILVLGIIYTIYSLFTGQGGSGLGDAIDASVYSSVVLFFSAAFILIYNFRQLKKEIDTIIFLIIGFPLTFVFVEGLIKQIEYNRTPNLIATYSRPVSKNQFIKDSLNIQFAINSLVDLRNKQTGGPDVQYAIIDTIIYSPKADKVWVSYIKKFEPNNLGNNFDNYNLFAKKRNANGWDLIEIGGLSGSYENINTLKKEVRKYYFNTYRFDPKDSNKENYFWK